MAPYMHHHLLLWETTYLHKLRVEMGIVDDTFWNESTYEASVMYGAWGKNMFSSLGVVLSYVAVTDMVRR